jgi:hypothetical protein
VESYNSYPHPTVMRHPPLFHLRSIMRGKVERKIDKSAVIVRNFFTLLLTIDKTIRQQKPART